MNKCPNCNTELIKTPMSMCIDRTYQKYNWCPKCHHTISDKDLENMHDAELIEEDTKIYNEVKKFA